MELVVSNPEETLTAEELAAIGEGVADIKTAEWSTVAEVHWRMRSRREA